MREEASAIIPGYSVPESMLFAHSTRLADSWEPRIERIVQPGFVRDPISLVFRICEGWSKDLLNLPGRRRRYLFMPRPRPRSDLRGELLHDLRYDVDSNVHHLFHSLLLLLLAQEAFEEEGGSRPKFKIVLRRNANPIATGICAMMGFATIESDANILGSFLVPSRDPRATATYSLLPRLAHMRPFSLNASTPPRLYLSRRGTRRVENEEQVWEFLRKRDFKRYFFDGDLPLLQQATLLGNARRIVAVHGAGLGWLSLNHGTHEPGDPEERLKLIELFGAGFIVDIYRQYAANLGALWAAVRGQITPDIVRDLDFQHQPRSHQADAFHVDLESLEAALAYIGN